jgi:hypothetical protein
MSETPPPDDEGVRKAVHLLATLERRLNAADERYPHDQLGSAIEALFAVLAFLPTIEVRGLTPLIGLLAELLDLSEGRRSRWLKPAEAKVGSSAVPHAERAFRAKAVATVEFLVERRIDPTRAAAVARVAGKIGETVDVVRHWDERLHLYKSERIDAPHLTSTWKEILKKNTDDMAPEAAADRVCEALKATPRDR